jgi:glycosyltransferase involved in cell wall biosynthesis
MNRFEMQSYAPLASRLELYGFASYMNYFELDNFSFPVKRLHATEEYYRFLPSTARGLIYGLSLHRGMNNKLFGLEKELQDKDIIHALETFNGYSYQSARVRNERKKKLVLTVWENIPFISTRQFMGWDNIPLLPKSLCSKLTANDRIVSYVKDNTDIFIAVTERAKSALMVEGVPEERIRVVPVGIDTDRFKPADADPGIRKKFNVTDDDVVVLFIGRLAKEKGIYDLLYATRLLAAEPGLGHVKIVIVGNGPEKENILHTIHTLGIDEKVRVVGGFSYELMPKLYNAADIFILPSIPMPFWQEQFGMVLVEAMASGMPVITTLSGSIPEVVGDSAILVQPNDLLSVYREIKRLALDPSLRKDYARRSRNRALEQYHIETIAGKIESVYKELA